MAKQTRSARIKQQARRSLNSKFSFNEKTYVADTSAVIKRFLPKLIKRGLRGKIIIPNAIMAELENLANKGFEEGFIGLEEIAKLHSLKKSHKITIYFYGLRPSEHQIKFAKSGEIDALIRDLAFKNKATLITADLIQAKSAQAYNIPVVFLKTKEKKKRKFSFFGK